MKGCTSARAPAKCVLERALSFDEHLNGFVILVGWPVEGYLNLHCLPVVLLKTRALVEPSFICNTSQPVQQKRPPCILVPAKCRT